MTIMTYTQAEHELTRVAARFEDWRHRRTTSSTPIPPSLWPSENDAVTSGKVILEHFSYQRL
jgi:hypothetical protein